MSEPQAAPSSSASNAQLLRPGEVVDGRYRVEAYLGGGGMASVYRAMHVVLEQPVALKIVSPQIREVPGVAARFIREARAATSLKGEHVARVFDVGTMADGAPYMVMEFLEGKDLGEILETAALPPVEDAVDWVLQACEALAEVHGRGIVHRDLKPANLFLTRGADGLPCVKLIDFGISRFESPLSPKDAHGLTQPDAIMGSPRYMSPEMMESASKADARSDIWGLGTVLYELLTGDAPYDGESFIEIYRKAVDGPPRAPSEIRADVPKALDEVITKCLRADPDDRYNDVAELATALAPFGHGDAAERSDAIARVLGATRSRPAVGDASNDDVALVVGNESSRVRRRVSRDDTSSSRAKRFTFFAVAAVSLVAIGAIGARAKVTRPEASAPTETAAAALPAAPAPAPVPVAPVASEEDEDDDAPPARAATTTASSPSALPNAAAPARTNADRRRRAPRHAASPATQAPTPIPPTTESAPSPSPENGKLFEDRK
jgi:eukaryotic-like serine/threonine-protein kinase